MYIKSFLFLCLLLAGSPSFAQSPFDGPLKVSPENPRYFTNNSGKAIYLAGSHTWENLQNIYEEGTEDFFDYDEYLDMMQDNGHNFMRMWVWHQSRMAAWTSDSIHVELLPFARTGPGTAMDGKPKFDLTKYNSDFFDRLRARVIEAGERGIYVSVMMFQGWSLDRIDSGNNPFPYLPFHETNNINGIAAPETPEDSDDVASLHSLKISPELLAVQEAYVRKVIETVNDLDNVLYEIINEGGAIEWQYHMINFIKETEAQMPKQHPVGMTHRGAPVTKIGDTMHNQDLFDSPADFISPNDVPLEWSLGDSTVSSSYRDNPPAASGEKVVINDTDHLWGHGGNHKWVWKSFIRGLHPVFMDPWSPMPGATDPEKTAGWLYDGSGITKDQRGYPDYELIRKHMGYTRKFALRINLIDMTPQSELSSTHYCLADLQKTEILVYFPDAGQAEIDLRNTEGTYTLEWYIPLLNRSLVAPVPVEGGDTVSLEPPTVLDAVLYLKRE